jgi:glycosyltransferase involved in cell wall biosynthesis
VAGLKQYTILHTIETWGPGGAETVLLNLASKLDRRRFRSLALLNKDGWLRRSLRSEGVETFVAESRRWCDFRLPRTMAKVVKRENVDLIHSHLPDQNFYSCLAGWLTGRKTIVTYHGPVEFSRVDQLRHEIKLRWVRHSAAVVVVVCDYVGQILTRVGFPLEKIVRIYNGIDTKLFIPGPERKLHDELRLPERTQLVGMVANLRHCKGYEFFIRAARKVADVLPHVQFVAVGGPVDEGVEERLTDLVRQLGLQDVFHFLGFRTDTPGILADLDVFVLSSLSEGFPLAILEAMAAGRPIVVTRCGGPAEVVEDGVSGLLVPPADADALASKICELLSDPGRAAVLGRNAQTRASRQFSLETMIENYERLYERTIGLN